MLTLLVSLAMGTFETAAEVSFRHCSILTEMPVVVYKGAFTPIL